jgi:WD40 repeat protein
VSRAILRVPTADGGGSQAVGPHGPYVGLAPYAEGDADFFFGRERERDLISANLIAYRLTLLYGPSGVGKSSVLRAAVMPHLRKLAARGVAGGDGRSLTIVMFSAWRDDPIAGLAACLERSIGGGPIGAESSSLSALLHAWTRRTGGDLLIILDQFEEYFLYHPHDSGPGTFAGEFPAAVNDVDLDVNFLLSIREDAIAKLDRFKGRIPRLFNNYLRIEHLTAEAARRAIEGPLEQYNRSATADASVAIEPALVDAVLDQIRVGQPVDAGAGRGVLSHEHPAAGAPIETSHLQMVMARLWAEERAQGSPLLRLKTFERLGGAERILQAHLDEAMTRLGPTEQDLAARVFTYLVTPSGTKIALPASTLASWSGVMEVELVPVLERLSAGDVRILRPVAPPAGEPSYEIFHDVLAPPILDWRTRHLHAQELVAAQETVRRQRRARRKAFLRKLGVVALVLLLGGLATTYLAWQQDRSRRFAAGAHIRLDADTQAGLGEALRAWDTAHTPEAETALRQALAAGRLRAVMTGHTGAVLSTQFSADGELLTAGKDGTARLWTVATGEQAQVFNGGAVGLLRAALSADGGRVVTKGFDGSARIWDARDGSRLAQVPGEFTAAALSPDGGRVVTGSVNGAVQTWDGATGAAGLRLDGHTAGVAIVAYSRNGRHLVTASWDGTLRVWDAATGGELARRDVPSPLNAAVFSPDADGRLVAMAGSRGEVRLWDWASGSDPRPLAGHRYQAVGAEFSRDGKLVVTAGDKVAYVWDARTGAQVAELAGHTDRVNAASFSDDGRRVVSASNDGTARVWDVASASAVVVLRGEGGPLLDATFSPDDGHVATAGNDGTARLWEVPRGHTLFGHDGWVLGAEYGGDGSYIVTAGADGTARVWQADTFEQLAVLSKPAIAPGAPGHPADATASGSLLRDESRALNDAAMSPDGRYVATAGWDGRVQVWDWRKRELRVSSDKFPRVMSVAFSPDGKELLTAGADGVGLWAWETAAPVRALGAASAGTTSGAFSRDGSMIVTAGIDGTARIWEPSTGRELAVLRGHTGPVYSAEFSRNGRYVVTSGGDLTARIWRADTRGEERAVVHVLSGHSSPLASAAFRPDGELIVTGTADGTTGVWNAKSGRNLVMLRQHADSVNSAAFSSDGGLILTASDDGSAKLYPCESCGPLPKLVELARSSQGLVHRRLAGAPRHRHRQPRPLDIGLRRGPLLHIR